MPTITKYYADGSSLSVEIDDNDIEAVKELIAAINVERPVGELADAWRDLEASKAVQRDLNAKLADERNKNQDLRDALCELERMHKASMGDASAWKGDDPNPVGVILKHRERVATVRAIDFGRKPMAYLEGFLARRDYRIAIEQAHGVPLAAPANPYTNQHVNWRDWAIGWEDAGEYPIDDIPDPSPWFA